MRIYKYDNLRFILMFLVVACHMMEIFNKDWVYNFYRIIYVFHMPVFIYLTGRFARFKKKRIFLHLIIPYIISQTLYLYFAGYVLSDEHKVTLQYTTPYWLLWFLLALIFYNMLLPMLPAKNKKLSLPAGIIIGVSIAAALIAGYDKSLGYYMTLSRTVVFFPFFLIGYYDPAIRGLIKIKDRAEFIISMMAISVILIFFGSRFVIDNDVSSHLLYGSYSYEDCGGSALVRIIIFAAAIGWIILFNYVIPNVRIPLITACGSNTMAAYLCHGFIVKLFMKNNVYHYSLGMDFVIALVSGLIITAALGLVSHGLRRFSCR